MILDIFFIYPLKSYNVNENVMETSYIYYLLDKSGSMSSRKSQVLSGMNEFIQDQKNLGSCVVSFYTFNNSLQTIFENKPIGEVEEIQSEEYVPCCSTALYDAMGAVLQKMEIPPDTQDKYILIVLTDGEENSSQHFTSTQLQSLIGDKKCDQLQIIYMGSNQDAILNGAVMGASRDSSLQYEDHNLLEAIRSTNTAVRRYRTSQTPTVQYTQTERNVSSGTDSQSRRENYSPPQFIPLQNDRIPVRRMGV